MLNYTPVFSRLTIRFYGPIIHGSSALLPTWVFSRKIYSDSEYIWRIYPLFYSILSEPHISVVVSRPHGRLYPTNTLSSHSRPNHDALAFMQLAIRSVPHRRDFYTRLLQGGDAEKFDAELAKWLFALDEIVEHLSKFLEQGGFGRV
jgi:hypothetical protein